MNQRKFLCFFLMCLLYISLYFRDGSSVGKAAKRYGILETSLMDWKINKYWETTKAGRQTGVSDIEETSLNN